jgi:hypothetical protein
MKNIKLTDVGQLKNELNKYRKGKKLDIRLFNQVARLTWLGRIVLSPLDPEDPDCRAWLLYLQPLDGLAREIITLDDDLNGMPFTSQIHILDAEQGERLAQIFQEACNSARESSKRSTSATSTSRSSSNPNESWSVCSHHCGRPLISARFVDIGTLEPLLFHATYTGIAEAQQHAAYFAWSEPGSQPRARS